MHRLLTIHSSSLLSRTSAPMILASSASHALSCAIHLRDTTDMMLGHLDASRVTRATPYLVSLLAELWPLGRG